MQSEITPLSDRDIDVSLAIGGVIRAKGHLTVAERALRRALDEAALLGITASDVETCQRLALQVTDPVECERESRRAFQMLHSMGANIEVETAPPSEQHTEAPNLTDAEFRALYWREGWFANVTGQPLNTLRWSAPGDAWKVEQMTNGFTAYTRFEKAHAQRKRAANAA